MSNELSRPRAEASANFHKGEIAILIATRGRPQFLAEVFKSLDATVTRKDQVVMWLYVDDDDSITREAIEKKTLPACGCAIHWHIGPRPSSLGETFRALWDASGGTAQICVTSVDDATFATPGWDERLRAVFDLHPDGVLLAFPHDPMTADQATYPFLGWNWIRTVGRIYPTYFPYWFGDKWLDQVGRMIGRCAKVEMTMQPVGGGKGKTKRMRNMPFWTLFFHLTLDERKEEAKKLLAAIHGQDTAARDSAIKGLDEAALPFVKERDDFSDVYCVFQEERFTELTPEQRDQFDVKFFQAECAAVSRLLTLAQEAMAKRQFADAMRFLDAVQFSDLRVRFAQLLKAECLRNVGRQAEAEALAKETLSAWPQMNLLRRTFRFLGMVANDGKRMLVGLTSKGKKG